jgi:hypothetical protein
MRAESGEEPDATVVGSHATRLLGVERPAEIVVAGAL